MTPTSVRVLLACTCILWAPVTVLAVLDCHALIHSEPTCRCTTASRISCRRGNITSILKALSGHEGMLNTLTITETDAPVIISNSAFRGVNAQAILLNYNRLWNIEPRAFRGVGPALAEINLKANLLKSVPMFDISNGMNVVTVNLESNHIAKLPTYAFRTTPKLQELHLGYNLISTVDSKAFAGLQSLQELSLFENRIEWLPDNLLHNMTTLMYLYLHGNAILDLPPQFLNFQTELIELNLASNALVEISDDAFRSLAKLEKLYLKDNQINYLSARVFWNLTALKILDLSGNKLYKVSYIHFKHLANLRALKMRHNDLHRIGADAFALLSNLLELDLTDNHISEIAPELFTGLKALKRLKLGHNKIINIPAAVFQDLFHIKTLDLSYNHLESLPVNIFGGLKNIETLNLNRNRLTFVPTKLFNNVGEENSLSRLNLEGNEILQIASGTFSKLKNLSYLNLANNNLSDIQVDTFEGLNNLQYLTLANNRIEFLTEGMFQYLGSLDCLYLDGNKIASISALMLQGLQSIQNIGLANNRFVGFPFEAIAPLTSVQKPLKKLNLASNIIMELQIDRKFQLYVRELDLSRNKIDTIVRDFFVYSGYSLESLDLSYNVISGFEINVFVNMRKLKRISIRGNNIPRLFEHPRVEVIDASENNITLFSFAQLTRLPRLGDLNLRSNKIVQFEPTNIRLASLHKLDLSHNHIVSASLLYPTSVKENILPNLAHLNLSANHISTLEGANVRGMPSLDLLDLSHNELTSTPLELWANPETQLKTVNLSHNLIDAFDDDSFRNLSTVRNLVITNLLNLRRISSKFTSTLTDLESLRFHDLPLLPKFSIDYATLLVDKPKLRDLAIEIKNRTLAGQLDGVMPHLTSLYITGKHLEEITDAAFREFGAQLTKQPDKKSFDIKLTITGICCFSI